jgi:putative NIF3 family GTP cyclohydrolase 1 type 2
MEMSRRSFLAGSGVFVAAAPATGIGPSAGLKSRPTGNRDSPPEGGLTAGDVIDRIKAHVSSPWTGPTVDNLVAGAPTVRVRGIATTMMATLDVLQRSATAGRNMVITHEPTFYSHQDNTTDLQSDPTYQFKVDFIRRHDMAVFHFHDHWHRRGTEPDGIAVGMARELGWEKYLKPASPREFALPETTLAELARDMEARLSIRTMRVLGDPSLRVRHVLASWGNVSLVPGIPYISRDDVDVLVVGETREWEVVEYVQDQIASGKKKGLIVLGHVVSEQAGMKYCAEWLRSFIGEVPIEFIAAAEPFWRPDRPVSIIFPNRPGSGIALLPHADGRS